MRAEAKLHEQLKAAGIPVESVRNNRGVYSIVYAPAATTSDLARGDAILRAFDPAPDADDRTAEAATQLPPIVLAALVEASGPQPQPWAAQVLAKARQAIRQARW